MANRITKEMSIEDIIIALAEGHPGSIKACVSIVNAAETSGLAALMLLDSMEIYGHRIYKLWVNICDKNIMKTLTVLTAFKLGYVTKEAIHHAIDNPNDGFNLETITNAVETQLDISGSLPWNLLEPHSIKFSNDPRTG